MAANTQAKPALDDQDVNDWKDRFNAALARPGEHIHSRSPEGAQSWSASLWGCFNPVDTCLITWCLPCITFGKTHHRLRKNGNLDGYEAINTSCLLFFGSGCCGLCWIPAAMQRQNVREKYNLQGNCVEDLACSFCCGCCVLVQSDKEAAHREGLLGNGQPQATQYEANNTGMVYPPTGEQAPAAAPAPVVTEK
jgi:Cys-rich protein (TIGR01571 family)